MSQIQVQQDILRSPRQFVLYLEGKTDLDYFFALLGRQSPSGVIDEGLIHQGILVKGCTGATGVRARVDLGVSFGPTAVVVGIIDGDGLPLSELAVQFDHPHAGPLYVWKAYSIENLLAKTGWPSIWGAEPNWQAVFREYGPYVVLNQLHRNVISLLTTLKIARITNPSANAPLKTDLEVIEALEADKHLIQGFNVAERFRVLLLEFQQAVDRDPNEVHALLNGKWLLGHLAEARSGRKPQQCQSDWIAHAISVGGLAEVRDWWERVTGSPP